MEALPTRELKVEYFRSQLNDLTELLPEVVELSGTCFTIASNVLADIDRDYGENAEQQELKYHIAQHSLDVTRRLILILNDLAVEFPDKIDARDYECGVLGACIHDKYQLEDGLGVNELKSAKEQRRLMFEANYNWPEITRTSDAIGATTVEYGDEGQIKQVKLREGSRDILKFALAMADINGAAMEGIETMLESATKLYIERTGDITVSQPTEYAKFLSSQARFLQERLDAVEGDIAYYFDEAGCERAMRVMKRLFEPSGSALELAKRLEKPLDNNFIEALINRYVGKSVSSIRNAHKVGKQAVERLTQKPQD